MDKCYRILETVNSKTVTISYLKLRMAYLLFMSFALVNANFYTKPYIELDSSENLDFFEAKAQILVEGTIVDQEGTPLPGVNVLLKGTTTGTQSDFDGKYSIQATSGDELVFSYLGMKTVTLIVGQSTIMDLTMQEDTNTLEEVVVVGYTAQKKGLLTGSVVSIDVGEELKNVPTSSAGNILAGKLSGVNVGTSNGIPGANPGISIRTGSSWNTQSVLYIIDGVVRGSGDFNNLSPNEIETVTVLKDAAAAAVYGARSAGGVILITTKRGKAMEKTQFTYSLTTGVDKRTKNAPRTNVRQTALLYDQMTPSNTANWRWSQEEIDYYDNINKGWGYDQLEAVWRDPSIQTHNLSATGGSDKMKFFVGGSYVKQQGFLNPLKYEKYNVRANLTVDITKNLELYAGFGLSNNIKGNNTWEGAEALYRKLLVWQPDQPVYDDRGLPAHYGWIANVGATVNGDGGYSTSNFLKPQVNFSATYKVPFVEGLSVKGAYATNFAYDRSKYFAKSYNMQVLRRSGENNHIVHTDEPALSVVKNTNDRDRLSESVSWGKDYQLNFQVNYSRVFAEDHQVQGVLVYEQSESSGSGFDATREDFPVYVTDQWWATDGSRERSYVGGQTDWVNGRISYVGQLGYDYKHKYLFNASVRRDGSMNFAADERWGVFPAASIGWIMTEEDFMSDISALDYLKLRASYGITGNDNVGGWQWQESYKSGGTAYFGTNPSSYPGITYGSIVNRFLSWEKSENINFGLDARFLNNFSATIEYWKTRTYDILGDRNVIIPTTFSSSLPQENYGEIKAQGFDFSFDYRNRSNDFDYYGGLVLSYGWNKVVKQDYAENAQEIDIPVGKSRSRIIGYELDRIIRTQADLDLFNTQNPNYTHGGHVPELGMMVYKDRSGPEGVPDGNIDSYDRIDIRENNFPIVYGLNLGGSWKNFSLDLAFSGEFNRMKSFRSTAANGVPWNRMWTKWATDSWTPENPNAMLPYAKFDGGNTYNTDSDFWFQKADFLRLRNATFSYSFPKNILTGYLDGLKVFFTGTNLFVLSSFDAHDPEIGDGFSYPIMRTYNFGLEVNF